MTMFKSPYRPDNKITQAFNDGIADIYAVMDISAPGAKPHKALAGKKVRVRYEERRLGISRYYSGRENQINISRVVRIPAAAKITNQDVLVDETGDQYRIDLVQRINDVYPHSLDLTLEKILQKYEVDT